MPAAKRQASAAEAPLAHTTADIIKDPLEGLPALESLRQEKNQTDAFADLRVWVRRHSWQGNLQNVRRQVGDDHQRAIVKFLKRESRAGLRRKVAKEILTKLRDDADFVVDSSATTPVQASAATIPLQRRHSVPRLDFSAIGSQAKPSAETFADECNGVEAIEAWSLRKSQVGRPPAAALVDPCADEKEIFRLLQTWLAVAAEGGRVDIVAEELPEEYRRKVFRFLARLACGTTKVKDDAQEIFRRLSASSSWYVDGMLDQHLSSRGGA